MSITPAQTLIAVDFGLKNMGLAVGNTVSRTATPLTLIKARDGVPDWEHIVRLVDEWRPARVIVGHPLNMDGSDSELSARAERFARQLEARLKLEVVLVDERLSSRDAKQMALASGHSGDFFSDPIDDQAAALILETYLSEL